jgi:8-oxo-dGTP pyrophosphatase MutT (NUDIX family)
VAEERRRAGEPAGGAKRRRRRRRKPAAATAATASGARAQPQRTTKAGAKDAGKKSARTSARKTGETSGREPTSKTRRGAGRKRRGAATARRKTRATSRRKGPSVPTRREISAGGVVYRTDVDGIEVVLASRRTRRGQLAWGLAKGGIEEDESMEAAAVREVREETGLDAEIEASLGETRYFYVWEDVRIRKTVHFFLMRHVGGDVDDRDDEMEEVRWFPLERALKRAAYRGEREVLARAADLLR